MPFETRPLFDSMTPFCFSIPGFGNVDIYQHSEPVSVLQNMSNKGKSVNKNLLKPFHVNHEKVSQKAKSIFLYVYSIVVLSSE